MGGMSLAEIIRIQLEIHLVSADIKELCIYRLITVPLLTSTVAVYSLRFKFFILKTHHA